MSGEGEFSAIYASVESGKGEECYELDKVEIQRRQLLPPAPYLIPKPGNKGRRKPPGSSHQLERKYTTLRKTNRAADNQYASVSRTSKSSLKSSTSSSHSVHKLNTLMEEGDIDQGKRCSSHQPQSRAHPPCGCTTCFICEHCYGSVHISFI